MSSFVRVSYVAIALTAACGGATSSSVGSGAASGDTGASGTNGAGSGTVAPSGANGAGSGTVAPSGANGAGSGTVAPSGTSGGGTTGTAVSSGAGGGTSGAAPVPGQITCGMATCEGTTPVCCVDARGSSCAASAADCATDAGRAVVVLTCTGKATCNNGDVCCTATQRPDGGRGAGELVTECAAQCGGAGAGAAGGEQVCTVNTDCSGGDTCLHFGAMAAYGVCVPGAGGRDGGAGGRLDAGRPIFDGGRPASDAGRPVFDGGRRIRDASID